MLLLIFFEACLEKMMNIVVNPRMIVYVIYIFTLLVVFYTVCSFVRSSKLSYSKHQFANLYKKVSFIIYYSFNFYFLFLFSLSLSILYLSIYLNLFVILYITNQKK